MAGKTCEVACVGQAVLDCISQGVEGDLGNDRYCTAREVRLSTGGDACNEAFVLAGLGRATRLVCGLGDDLAGEAILAKARSLGIDVSQATVSGSLTTPVAPLLLAPTPTAPPSARTPPCSRATSLPPTRSPGRAS